VGLGIEGGFGGVEEGLDLVGVGDVGFDGDGTRISSGRRRRRPGSSGVEVID